MNISQSAAAPFSPVARMSHTRPSQFRRALFPLGMLAATAGIFWMIMGHSISHGDVEALPPEVPRGNGNPNAVAVTVAPIVMRPVQRSVEAVGTLYGYEEVTLSAKIEGRVKKILRDVSDRVAPDETIIELDPVDAELSVRQAQKNLLTELARLGLTEPPQSSFDVMKVPVVTQAQVRLENAKAKAERSAALAKKTAISTEELAERMTEFRSAEAELANQILIANAGLATIQMRQESLAIVKQQLEDIVIRAPSPTKPILGLDRAVYAVTKRNVSEGTLVRVGDEVCRLVIDKNLKLRVAVPERYGADVKLGQKVDVYTSSSLTPFSGEVSRINPSVDTATRTFEVEVLCANSEGKLKPGGFAKAAIATRLDTKAATVPLEALVTFAGISKIFLHEGNKVREVRVAVGVQNTDWIEITSPPLPEDAQVVISGQTALADGSTVFVRNAKPEPTATQPELTSKTH